MFFCYSDVVDVVVCRIKVHIFCITDGYGRRLLDFWRWTEGRPELPITLGRDFCGIIKDVGSAVDFNLKIGDTVWGVIEPHQSGSFAEFIVVDQKYVR